MWHDNKWRIDNNTKIKNYNHLDRISNSFVCRNRIQGEKKNFTYAVSILWKRQQLVTTFLYLKILSYTWHLRKK